MKTVDLQMFEKACIRKLNMRFLYPQLISRRAVGDIRKYINRSFHILVMAYLYVQFAFIVEFFS